LFYKSLLTSVGGTPPLQLITLPAENPFNTWLIALLESSSSKCAYWRPDK
jgi:hypothetical protein